MSTKIIKDVYLKPIVNFIKCFMRRGSIDANDFIDTGIYAIGSGTEKCYNFPFENPNGLLEVYRGDITCIKHVFTQNGGATYLRLYWFGIWGPWKLVVG